MALTYSSAIAALLNNGSTQVLPISRANLIELAGDKTIFGTSAQSVQDALGYLAGSFEHANTVAKDEADRAQANAYAYVGSEINNLDVAKVGSATDTGHDKFISYIYQENGYIHAFAQDMSAANVAYSGSDNRATVADELAHINATIADNLTATTLKLVNAAGEVVENKTVTADGTEYSLKQGENVVAKFNIEKDSFVKSGSVVRGTLSKEGVFKPSDNGEYFIKLEIKTHDAATDSTAEHTLYIPAESLVDAYTANNGDGDGNSVTVTVDQEHNTISAKIKAGGVGTAELAGSAVTTEKIADSAVTTAKIADNNVTKAKLADDVQASLGKADSAVQSITTGSTHGTIKVDNTDVAVNLDDLKAIATTGAAANVTVATITELDAMAGASVTNVQTALEKLAGKVKAINDGAVTSVKTSVVDSGKDTQNAVTISMTPTEAKNGAVTVELTHNLGSAAALDYDMKTVATPVSQAFWESVK